MSTTIEAKFFGGPHDGKIMNIYAEIRRVRVPIMNPIELVGIDRDADANPSRLTFTGGDYKVLEVPVRNTPDGYRMFWYEGKLV